MSRILIAEDEEALCAMCARALTMDGHEVKTAADGSEALDLLTREEGAFDLLLTDVVMPGMNGRILAEQLSPRQPGMKILYMSGYTDSFIAGHGVLDPRTLLLHKPFTEEVLLRKVREVLDSGTKSPSVSSAASESITSEVAPGR